MLIIAKADGEKYKLISMVPYDKITLSQNQTRDRIDIQHVGKEKFSLHFENLDQQTIWFTVIQDAVYEYMAQKTRVMQAQQRNNENIELIKADAFRQEDDIRRSRSRSDRPKNSVTSDDYPIKSFTVPGPVSPVTLNIAAPSSPLSAKSGSPALSPKPALHPRSPTESRIETNTDLLLDSNQGDTSPSSAVHELPKSPVAVALPR
jgi:hypothetical protein